MPRLRSGPYPGLAGQIHSEENMRIQHKVLGSVMAVTLVGFSACRDAEYAEFIEQEDDDVDQMLIRPAISLSA